MTEYQVWCGDVCHGFFPSLQAARDYIGGDSGDNKPIRLVAVEVIEVINGGKPVKDGGA